MTMTSKDRNTGEVQMKKDSKSMKLLYETKGGRGILKVLSKPFLSKTVGIVMASSLSAFVAYRIIKKNKIDVKEYSKQNYRSFNDFFTRKIKVGSRYIDKNKNTFIAPADSKLSVFHITEDSLFKIKGSYYSTKDLLDGDPIYKDFNNGYALIFRLEVTDYHRYCYIDDGYQGENHFVKGILHTVRPIALKNYNIYKRNCREYTILHTRNFGDIAHVEVGAMMVGKIVNHHENYSFEKGEEKGLFEYGGSTIVLLVKKDVIEIDKDILENSNYDIETIVKYGEKIAKKKKLE